VKKPRIAIHGYDLLGRHIARALRSCEELEVGVVIERDAALAHQARAAGYSVSAGRGTDCDAEIGGARPAAWVPGRRRQGHVLPDADCIVLERLLKQIGGVESWAGLSCTSAGCHDLSCAGGLPDRLEPIFSSRERPGSKPRGLGLPRGRVNLHRVHVPCFSQRIYYLHLIAKREWTAEELERVIDQAPECLPVRAAEGFGNTGLIDEHFRDLGIRQGDRSDIVIWRESLVVDRHQVYLMAEADPFASVAGEAVKALRRILGLSMAPHTAGKKGAGE
jgi:hypothetical protein